uniref:Uncharacterized protein n=1 Tax=Anguilla anguilla TaxID=7936 RepID=A0A0E9WPZ5_ANGAN
MAREPPSHGNGWPASPPFFRINIAAVLFAIGCTRSRANMNGSSTQKHCARGTHLPLTCRTCVLEHLQ